MTSDREITPVSADADLAWLERHAARILIAGALVAANLMLIVVVGHFQDLGVLEEVLIGLLAVASLLLLHRVVRRMMRDAVETARREHRVARDTMRVVEHMGHEPAGMRGTVEALSASAQPAGLEVFIYDSAASTLWSPSWGSATKLGPAQVRGLLHASAQRSLVHIADGHTASSVLPVDVCVRGGSSSLVAAPMGTADELYGIIVRRYADEASLRRATDHTLLASIAALGTVAIGKALVVDREQQRARDNELLLRSVHASSELQQRERIAAYVQHAADAVDSERAVLFALERGRLRVAAAVGTDRLAIRGAGTLRLRSALCAPAGDALDVDTPRCLTRSQLDERSQVVLERLGLGEHIAVEPLHDANGLLGLIVVDDVEQLPANDRAMLSAIGRQAARAIERSRMQRAIRKRSRHLACAPKLARNLTGQRDAHDIARTVARELTDGFSYHGAMVYLLDSPHTDDITTLDGADVIATSGSTDSCSRTCDDAMLECLRTARPYVGVMGGEPPLDDDTACDACRGRIVVPVSGHDRRVVGAIAVVEPDADVLGEDDLHMLETIADQLGSVLEQATLFASLERSYFETVEALSSALEAKDAYTLDHARSITDMSAEVGRRLGMREAEIRDLKLGALLHDIGKIGVPTEILSKEGPLTDDEFDVMKEHTIIGEQIIASVEFLQGVRPLVLHEHERWDGHGYPHQLREEEIPLGARIIFVCDSWHAMTSDRPYRAAMPEHAALAELERHAGTQFDPAVVAAFCEMMRAPESVSGGASTEPARPVRA